jgi:hypothetical protein
VISWFSKFAFKFNLYRYTEESLGSISDASRKAHSEMCRARKTCLSDEEAKRTQALADDRQIMQSGRRQGLYAGGHSDLWRRRLIIESVPESCDIAAFVLKTLLPSARFMRATQNVNDHSAVVARLCLVQKDVTAAPEKTLTKVGAI